MIRESPEFELCCRGAAKADGYDPDKVEIMSRRPIWRRYESLVVAILAARFDFVNRVDPSLGRTIDARPLAKLRGWKRSAPNS